MGWLFGHDTRESLIAARTAGEPRHFAAAWKPYYEAHWSTREVLAHKVVGNELWMVVRATREFAESETAPVTDTKVDTFIALDLLDRSEGRWGYKDMAESSHPYYYGCPLKYLDMAPEECPEWRAELRKVHAATAAKRTLAKSVAVGDTLVLVEGCNPASLEVVSASPLRGKDANGTVYKVPRKMIERVEKPVAGLTVAAV